MNPPQNPAFRHKMSLSSGIFLPSSLLLPPAALESFFVFLQVVIKNMVNSASEHHPVEKQLIKTGHCVLSSTLFTDLALCDFQLLLRVKVATKADVLYRLMTSTQPGHSHKMCSERRILCVLGHSHSKCPGLCLWIAAMEHSARVRAKGLVTGGTGHSPGYIASRLHLSSCLGQRLVCMQVPVKPKYLPPPILSLSLQADLLKSFRHCRPLGRKSPWS